MAVVGAGVCGEGGEEGGPPRLPVESAVNSRQGRQQPLAPAVVARKATVREATVLPVSPHVAQGLPPSAVGSAMHARSGPFVVKAVASSSATELMRSSGKWGAC